MTTRTNIKVLSVSLPIMMIFLLMGSGCYYDDGPVLSFRSTKGRIANVWTWAYAEQLGTNVTDDYTDARLVLSKDGSLGFELGDGTTYTGEWVLSFDRKLLTISYGDQNDTYEEIFVILRLKQDEMWLQQEVGDQLRWELVAK